MEDSILITIKRLIGYTEEETDFDPELTILINSTLSRLNTMGVGPDTSFTITDVAQTWADFVSGKTELPVNLVKEYVYLKVKLVFDAPTNSNVLKCMEDRIKELEWLLNVECDNE